MDKTGFFWVVSGKKIQKLLGKSSERTETMQMLFIKKKSPRPAERGPLSRGQQRRARGRGRPRPGRGGVDAGSARASRRTAAPGAVWRGGLGQGPGEKAERRLHRKAFRGDALRPPGGRRGSSPIKVAAWKEGRREGGTGTVGRRSSEPGRGDS